ncbi:hypothetical protein G7072_17355 [Nocardioides sp. HDW12B]|uniref:HAAS signaling domain-containing protein n=1 Tax=Nocardioides sp. HDW12B TaxID=2714939 RepID=UPI0014099B09|nr:hypothetical protein [Nocardioides sp. HDW12B]QIK67877.1 hypothetical protein G7072_17355 [Nocardioides sp. HDW12B]
MTTPPPPPFTRHPAVARYLDELERLLRGVDPVERTEVLDGVREHLEASLHGTAGGDAVVRAALDEIGPPQVVADEAYAGRPGVTLASWAASSSAHDGRVPITSRRWVPMVVLILGAMSLLNFMLLDWVSASSGDGELGPLPPTTSEIVLGSIGLALWFWLPMALLVAWSTLWPVRERVLLLALWPLALLLHLTLPAQLTQRIVLLGGLAALSVLAARGSRRVPRPPGDSDRHLDGPREVARVRALAPVSSRGWLPASVALLQALALLLVVMVTSSANTVSSTENTSFGPDGQVVRTVGETTFDGQAGAGLVGMLAAFPCWLPLLLLVTSTVLWTRRERLVLIAVAPLASFLLGTLPTIGWTLLGEDGFDLAGLLGEGLGLFGGVTVTAVLVRRALVRAAALQASEARGAPTRGPRTTSADHHDLTHQEPR